MNLSILLTKNHRLLSLIAIIDVFETANTFLEDHGSTERYEINVVGLEDKSNLPEHLRKYPYHLIAEWPGNTDSIFVPAFRSEDMEQTIADNAMFIPLLIQQQAKGATIVSLCTGSFLLAASGLLDGKQATTHIEAAEHFSKAFPHVKLQPHAIVTQSENIFTSGGATSSFHMKLLLIQRQCGRDIAIRVAKNFAIDMDRSNQLYFEHFKPSLAVEDELVRAVQLYISQKFGEIKNVEEALEIVPSSRRNIIRRFKQATGMTPIRYLQKTKIEAAKKLLEMSNRDMLDVMLASGYNDSKNFRQLFKSFTGLTPKGYRDKFGMRLG